MRRLRCCRDLHSVCISTNFTTEIFVKADRCASDGRRRDLEGAFCVGSVAATAVRYFLCCAERGGSRLLAFNKGHFTFKVGCLLASVFQHCRTII